MILIIFVLIILCFIAKSGGIEAPDDPLDAYTVVTNIANSLQAGETFVIPADFKARLGQFFDSCIEQSSMEAVKLNVYRKTNDILTKRVHRNRDLGYVGTNCFRNTLGNARIMRGYVKFLISSFETSCTEGELYAKFKYHLRNKSSDRVVFRDLQRTFSNNFGRYLEKYSKTLTNKARGFSNLLSKINFSPAGCCAIDVGCESIESLDKFSMAMGIKFTGVNIYGDYEHHSGSFDYAVKRGRIKIYNGYDLAKISTEMPVCLITMCHIVHHIPVKTLDKLFKSVYDKLQTGGVLLIKDVNIDSQVVLDANHVQHYIYSGILSPGNYDPNDPNISVLAYSYAETIKKLEKIGFSVEYSEQRNDFINTYLVALTKR